MIADVIPMIAGKLVEIVKMKYFNFFGNIVTTYRFCKRKCSALYRLGLCLHFVNDFSYSTFLFFSNSTL